MKCERMTDMIYRHMLMGYYREKNICVSAEAYYSAVQYYEDKVFVYVEVKDGDCDVKGLVNGDFIAFPDGSRLAAMNTVFAYSPSDDDAVWERQEVKTPEFRIAYLKDDGFAKYIFYHYKLQGESINPTDRYGSIFVYGNILIMYLENPRVYGEHWKRFLPENNLPGYDGDIIADCSYENKYGTYWHTIVDGE